MAPTTEPCHVWYDLVMLLDDLEEEGESFVMAEGSATLYCVRDEGHEGPHALAQGGLGDE